MCDRSFDVVLNIDALECRMLCTERKKYRKRYEAAF